MTNQRTRRFHRNVGRFLLAAAVAVWMGTAGGCVLDQGTQRVQLITLDPGHFHAALVQKSMYANVEPVVHVFAPAGDDLQQHLKRIEGYNTRAESPTHWKEEVYDAPDWMEKMFATRPGNVVVLSGNNLKKTDYILKSVQAGLNVLADKPMAVTPADYEKLKLAFSVAKEKHVLLYDIMTERFEINTILQKELSRKGELFGEQVKGTAEQPGVEMESVHYFSKVVSGSQLKRPAWFFDVKQEGEALPDVGTHLVDLVQWEVFPEQALSPSDATVTKARRWAIPITKEQFTRVTGEADFPAYLAADVKNGILQEYANGEMTYKLKDVWCKVTARWEYEAKAGGDSHYSVLRGTKGTLTIKQGAEQAYKPVLYVEPVLNRSVTLNLLEAESRVRAAINALQWIYPGVGYKKAAGDGVWEITVPAKYDVGHEAHFAAVTENYLAYLKAGKMPDWEIPNMLTKTATIMKAYEMSR